MALTTTHYPISRVMGLAKRITSSNLRASLSTALSALLVLPAAHKFFYVFSRSTISPAAVSFNKALCQLHFIFNLYFAHRLHFLRTLAQYTNSDLIFSWQPSSISAFSSTFSLNSHPQSVVSPHTRVLKCWWRVTLISHSLSLFLLAS